MLKKILTILLILTSSANAEEIKDIKIFGNQRISSETIKVYGDIKIGRDISNIQINEILKNLYLTNFFEIINITFEKGVLNLDVKEYPIINEINLEGEKSNNIKKAILDKLNLKSRESFISSKLNDDISIIKKAYSSLGYNFTTVKVKVENFSQNRVNLLFDISKGEKIYIKNIKFIGDKKIKDSRLRNVIVSDEHKFWKFLSKNTVYNESNIELDKRLLINYYKSLGYYDVQVLSDNATIRSDYLSDIVYTINAGKRFKISKISTNTDKVIDKKIFEPLLKDYDEFIGKYYSPFKVKKILDSVNAIILDNDLQFVENSVNEIIDNDNIEIRINIYEGSRTLVERLDIIGNTVTDEAVIRSELLLDEGDPLNLQKLDQSIAKIKARNIFGEVSKKILDGTNNNQKIVEISVTERPTGEISAGAGVGTNGGTLAFSVSENNWLGKGINVSTNFNINPETFTGEFSVIDPNFNFSGNVIEYFASNVINDKPDSGYKNNLISTGIGTKFEQFKDIYLSSNINFSYDDLKVEDTASTSLKNQKGTFSDLTFDYSISSDQRDIVYAPTDGYITSFSQTLPLYADSPYIRNSITYSKYKSLNPNVVAAFKIYASGIQGFNKDVRLSKRLNLSSNRLRGFEQGKIGPKDGVDYVGGNYVASSNFEINLPNILPESTKTDVILFLDFGNVWHVDYDKSLDDSNKIRSSVGVTTSWNSPIGPMSFVFSENVSKAATDITESFNFRLGTTF